LQHPILETNPCVKKQSFTRQWLRSVPSLNEAPPPSKQYVNQLPASVTEVFSIRRQLNFGIKDILLILRFFIFAGGSVRSQAYLQYTWADRDCSILLTNDPLIVSTYECKIGKQNMGEEILPLNESVADLERKIEKAPYTYEN
jgi:hypothetical protein